MKQNVWMCCPTKRSPSETAPLFAKWRTMGYKLALWRDIGDEPVPHDLAGFGGSPNLDGKYPGYAAVQNQLIREIFAQDPHCNWVVSAADDIEPDACHEAEEIAEQCSKHFESINATRHTFDPATFGVMQPTGDRWGDRDGAYIDRVAGSPWIGREFARRAYGGNGPYWPEYTHMFVDAEIQDVAKLLGVFWQRRELIHYHAHWGRPQPGEIMGHRSRMPAFLEGANSPEHWAKFKALYEDRKRRGFPGYEVLA